MSKIQYAGPMLYAKTIKAPLLLLLLGCVWGVGYSLSRYVTTHGVSPLGYAFWQTLGPALLLSLYGVCQNTSYKPLLAHFPFFVWLGFLGIALPNGIMYTVAPHLPSSLVAVIVNTVPIFTYLMALIMREERFGVFKCLAVVLCVMGLFLMQYNPNVSNLEGIYNPYVILGLLTPCCFAIASVMTARFAPSHLAPHALASGMLWMACLWIVPYMLWRQDGYWLEATWQMRDSAIVLEILLSSLGYILFFRLIRLAGSVYYSFVGGVVALVGLVWGAWVLDEQFSGYALWGMSLVLISLVIINQWWAARGDAS